MTDGKFNLSDLPPTEATLNILCHRDDVEIVQDRADVLEITPESTLAMAAKFSNVTWDMAKQDADFVSRLKTVFPDLDIDNDKHLRDYPIAVRHIVGMIVSINMAINTGKMPFVRYPETYLHPSSQANVADLLIRYSKEMEENSKTAHSSTG